MKDVPWGWIFLAASQDVIATFSNGNSGAGVLAFWLVLIYFQLTRRRA